MTDQEALRLAMLELMRRGIDFEDEVWLKLRDFYEKKYGPAIWFLDITITVRDASP